MDTGKRLITRTVKTCKKMLSELEIVDRYTDYNPSYIEQEMSESKAIELFDLSVKMAFHTRNFISMITVLEPDKWPRMARESLADCGYGFGFTDEGWIRIHLPPAISINQNKLKDFNCFYRDQLYYLACDFKGNLDAEISKDYPLQKPMVIFKHVVAEGRLTLPDYDNTDSKRAVNALAATQIIVDDSPLILTTYHCTQIADFNALFIYVMPKEDFPKWMQATETLQEKPGY